MLNRYISLVFIILIPLFSSPAFCTLNADQITQWKEDIDSLQKQLEERHIHLYHRISKEDFTHQLNKVKQDLPNLSQPELMVKLMAVVKQVGDGHTQFNYWGSTHHHYPLRLKQFGDQLRLTDISSTHKHLLGMRLYSINSTHSNQLIQTLRPVLQGVENSFSEQHRLTETLIIAEVLEGLHITKPGLQAMFTFVDDKGKLYPITLNAKDTDSLASLPKYQPSGFTRHKISSDSLNLFINSSSQTLYLDFKKYPRLPEMESFVKKLQELIKDNNIKRMIIDFRHNGGGDFFIGLTLAWGLIMVDSLDWQNGIYVLIGRQTFSASMSNAVQYRQILNATLVGELTGSNPVGYQDADTFELPHSGWKVMYSKRLYRFQEQSTQGVQPDVYLPEDWNEFVQGKDNQLKWILNKIQK